MLARGATAAMAFSSQSVMTLAYAGAGVPTATQAPIMAAGTEPLIVWAIKPRPRSYYRSMNPENRSKLAGRVVKVAEAALAARHYVSPVDVLVGIGWLDPGAVERWRQGQIDYLERVVQTNLSRISEAMKLFRSWATAKGLHPSETAYVARTPQRHTLRFS